MTWLPANSRPDTAATYRAPRSNDRSPAAARSSASLSCGFATVITKPFNIKLPAISRKACAVVSVVYVAANNDSRVGPRADRRHRVAAAGHGDGFGLGVRRDSARPG